MFPQEGIETVGAAYEVFLQDGFEDFQPFSFELKTIARKNLSTARVKEYLKVIHKQSGVLGCKEVLEYVLMALAKYLQITVAYSIFKGEPQKATDHFEQFNEQFENLCEVFQEVTHRSFISGMISAQRDDMLPQVIPRFSKHVSCFIDCQ